MQFLRFSCLVAIAMLLIGSASKEVASAITVGPLFDFVYPDKLTEKPLALVRAKGGENSVREISKKSFLKLTNATFVNSVATTTDAKVQYDQEVKKTPKWMQKVRELAALSTKQRMVEREILMQTYRKNLRKIKAKSRSKEVHFYDVYDAYQKLSVPEIFLIYSQPLLEKKSSDLYFGKEPNAGFGVATRTRKHPGEFLGLYAGRLLKLKKEVTLGKNKKFLTFQSKMDVEYGRELRGIKSFPRAPYSFRSVAVSAANRRNLTALINDSEKSNVTAIIVLTPAGWATVLVARCNIEPHEKLSWSYGPGYWAGVKKKALPGPLDPIDFESLSLN